MKRLSIVCLAFVLAITFGFANAYAASSKATAQCINFREVNASPLGLTASTDDWQDIFTTIVRTPNEKELFIDVSLECGLTTNTKVMSRNLVKAIADAEAKVEVRVLVDDKEADPGVITFAKRKQTMIAEFAGYIKEECYIINEDSEGNHTVTIDPDCVQEETLQLILDTVSANSFNFISSNLTSDDHTIKVQARLTYTAQDPEYTDADAPATTAYLGKGSVTIDTVRMIKGEVVDLTTQQ